MRSCRRQTPSLRAERSYPAAAAGPKDLWIAPLADAPRNDDDGLVWARPAMTRKNRRSRRLPPRKRRHSTAGSPRPTSSKKPAIDLFRRPRLATANLLGEFARKSSEGRASKRDIDPAERGCGAR